MILIFALIFIAAACKAVQDTLAHHWSGSIFDRGNSTAYWGDASRVWLRRYIDEDSWNPRKPILSNPILRALLIPVWDGWHLLALVRAISICALPAASGAPLWTLPVLLLVHSLVFEGIYRFLD